MSDKAIAEIDITVFDVVAGKFDNPRVRVIQGNLMDKGSIVTALRASRAAAVLHTASPHPNGTNKKVFFDVNVTGTRNVIDACVEVGVRTLVFTSSASVVWAGEPQAGVTEAVPYPETYRDYYAQTKAEAEKAVMNAGATSGGRLTTVCLRPHAIFGPKDAQLVPTTVQIAQQGKLKFIIGDGTNLVDWTYIGNVVHSHMLALQAAHRPGGSPTCNGKTYFITNGEPVPFWLFMNWLAAGFGYDTSKFRLPFGLMVGIATIVQAIVGLLNKFRPQDRPIVLTFSPSRLKLAGTVHWYSIDAARRDLGYAPLWGLKQGLYLTLKSFAHYRNVKPSRAALSAARSGNLVSLGLVVDTEAPKVPRPDSGLSGNARGANSGEVDPSTLPAYTRAQIATHNKADDVWLIIDGLVYDVTSYVQAHPGGEAILTNAGGDASEGFHGPQHPAHVPDTVRKFLIGRLAK